MDKASIKEVIFHFSRDLMQQKNVSKEDMSDDFDLIHSGFIDSVDFIELITALERAFEIQIKFEDDITKYFTLSGLIQAVLDSNKETV